MKRPFSRRRNTLGALIAAFLAAVVVLAIFFLVRILLPGFFIAAAAPFWREGSALDASVGTAFAGIGNAQKLAGENNTLKTEVQTLQNENAVLTARAQDLTKLLGGAGQSTGDIVAGVLARPPESPYDTLIVAAGSADGVTVTSEVFATGGIPIGTVESVTAHTATISLLSSPGRTTSGWAGQSRTPITLTGQGTGAFEVTLPKAAPISKGDSVYVPGPGAVPIGTIANIDSDPSSPSIELDIQPFVNIFSLTWVEIVRAN